MYNTTDSTRLQATTAFLASIGAACFPLQPGTKVPLPGWRWTEDSSTDPAQWSEWLKAGHSLGVNAGKSALILVDIDAKGDRDGAWSLYCDLCAEWSIPVALPAWQTPSGGWHVLFRAPEGVALRQPDAIKGRINVRAGNGYALCPPSEGYVLLDGATVHDAPEGLIRHCSRAERKPAEHRSRQGEHSLRDVKSMLRFMSEDGAFDSYEDWISIGQALKIAFLDDGLPLWESVTVPGRYTCDEKWPTFKDEDDGNAVTLATWFQRAREAGWRLTAEEMFAGVDLSAAMAAAQYRDLIKSSGQFVEGFIPPDYVIDGMFMRGFLYCLTAKTGGGKTAIALLWAICVALGRAIGPLEVMQGDVVYFCLENEMDVRMRWIALCSAFGVKPEDVPVHFIYGVKISEATAAIEAEIKRKNIDPVMVVVDTVQASFEGDNDNDNVQMLHHARGVLRPLTRGPGNPFVLALAHPTKNASEPEGLVPKGGGAFLNEIDGNLGAMNREGTLATQVVGKFRGPETPPVRYKLRVVKNLWQLRDSKGRFMPTVVAEVMNDADAAKVAAAGEADENKLLLAMGAKSEGSQREWAAECGWHHSKVQRLLEVLETQKMVRKQRHRYVLTTAGASEVGRLEAEKGAPTTPPWRSQF